LERRPELFGQILGLELNFDDDHAAVAGLGFEPDQRPVIAM
jgi:hypothetical protein